MNDYASIKSQIISSFMIITYVIILFIVFLSSHNYIFFFSFFFGRSPKHIIVLDFEADKYAMVHQY